MKAYGKLAIKDYYIVCKDCLFLSSECIIYTELGTDTLFCNDCGSLNIIMFKDKDKVYANDCKQKYVTEEELFEILL